MKIKEPGVCGAGYYCVEDSVGEISFDTHDCSGASDEFEGAHTTSTGQLRIDTLEAGNGVGNFSGQPLLTRIAGYLPAHRGLRRSSQHRLELLRWCHPPERVSRPTIEFSRDAIQLFLVEGAEIG